MFSFMGSMTPGTINLSVLQTGLERKPYAGIRMAAAAAMIEYLYAWIAVTFEFYLTSTPAIFEHLQLISGVVMLVLGLSIIRSAISKEGEKKISAGNGFRKGLVLGILNPLAMPYWIGVTAYFRSQGWVQLDTVEGLHLYLLGVSLGVFSLLLLVTLAAGRLSVYYQSRSSVLKKLPGFIMLALAVFAFIKYFSQFFNT